MLGEMSRSELGMGSMADEITPIEVQGRALENGGWETTCWGCRLRLLLPVFAPIFKCGWCGAITIYKPPAKPRSKCSPTLEIARDRVLVVAVLLLIVSIVYGGVWTVFPILFPKVSLGFLLNSTITALLTFNTLLNYCFAALIQAGSPPQVEWAKYDMVGKGSLEGYRFCVHCQQPKPPSAHHCRICRSCIVDMDHHCPFIGNCVGANNHRYFILFLGFTTVSCIYVLILVVYTFSVSWRNLMEIHHDDGLPPLQGTFGMRLMANILSAVILDTQFTFSMRLLSLVYLFVASVALLIGVGLLLQQQLWFVYRGDTYINNLYPSVNRSKNVVTGSQGWTNLYKVFGRRHPVFWIFPTFSPNKLHVR